SAQCSLSSLEANCGVVSPEGEAARDEAERRTRSMNESSATPRRTLQHSGQSSTCASTPAASSALSWPVPNRRRESRLGCRAAGGFMAGLQGWSIALYLQDAGSRRFLFKHPAGRLLARGAHGVALWQVSSVC